MTGALDLTKARSAQMQEIVKMILVYLNVSVIQDLKEISVNCLVNALLKKCI